MRLFTTSLFTRANEKASEAIAGVGVKGRGGVRAGVQFSCDSIRACNDRYEKIESCEKSSFALSVHGKHF